jgi:hypothetical protein
MKMLGMKRKIADVGNRNIRDKVASDNLDAVSRYVSGSSWTFFGRKIAK